MLAGATRGWAQPAPAPDGFLRDAELADVFFVDPDRGWTVGDRGAIWHTEDGGRHWGLQPSPVACRLESVCFIDDRHGWIVGGWAHPYTGFSTGVVLQTADGGQRWEVVPRLPLPRLRRVKFLDKRTGWAAGEASAMYPAGVFQTSDGGRSWSSVMGAQPEGWLAADFPDGHTALVGGRCGAVAALRQMGLEPGVMPPVGLRNVRCVRVAPLGGRVSDSGRGAARLGWLAGDGGLVLRTTDAGRTWHEPPERLPDGMYDQFDYRAVATAGNCCWMAGAPGSRILHSADGGQSWSVFSTGQNLPLRALTFLDHERGWAVGALGTILATRDGGRTWVRQQQDSSRVALLGLFARPTQLPLELLAAVSSGDGYLSAVHVLCRTDSDRESAAREQRTHEAVVTAGGSQADTAWCFPVPPPGVSHAAQDILARWSPADPQRGCQRLEECLVRAVRQWRPDVVVTEPAGRGDDGLTQLLNQLVLAAVQQAADPAAFPGQWSQAGLAPWKVGKVYGAVGPNTSGTLNITTSQLVPRLSCAIADQAGLAWPLLRGEPQPPPQTVGFRLLVDRRSDGERSGHMFSGVSVAPGTDGRRPPSAAASGDLRTLARRIQQRHNIQQLVGHLGRAPQNGVAWIGQVEELTRGLAASDSGDILYELAHTLHRGGRSDLAAEVYDLLIKRQPRHPLCEPALLWLVQYHASGEALCLRSSTPPVAGIAEHNRAPDAAEAYPVQQAVYEVPVANPSPAGSSRPLPRPALEQKTAVAPPRPRGGAERALEYARWIQSTRPALYAEPCVRFPASAAARQAGMRREAEAFYHGVVGGPARDAWWTCARSELWLLRPERRPPQPLVRCVTTDKRPRLDGCLEDETWRAGEPIVLSGPAQRDAPAPDTTEVRLARDQEFLYFAARCPKAAGVSYTTTSGVRQRDADLSAHDRLEVLLDVDRDYATCFRLVVDYQGWASESCLSSAAWNPQWYIAAAQDETSWSIEAAIPWKELGDQAPEPQTCWAAGLRRVIPGAGLHAWPETAGPGTGPEAFGLLRFE